MKIATISSSILLAVSLLASQFAQAQRVVVRVEPRHRHHPRPVVVVAPRPVYVAPRPVVVVAPRPVVVVAPRPVVVTPRRVYVAPRRVRRVY